MMVAETLTGISMEDSSYTTKSIEITDKGSEVVCQ